MELSKHAESRIRQRGVTMAALNIIWMYGRESIVPGGAIKYFFGRYEYQYAINDFEGKIQVLDRAKGGTIILTGGNIITVYKN